MRTLFPLVLLVLLPGASPATSNGYVESYEQGWGGWVPKHYLECEFQVPPCWPLDWSIERSTEQAFDGSWSLKAFLNGDHDDGTLWVERCFDFGRAGSLVGLQFWLWSEEAGEVNRFPVVAYIGPRPPRTEADFRIVGEDNLVTGWHAYQHVGSGVGPTWVAFGFTATWEGARTHYLDRVELSLFGATSGDASPSRWIDCPSRTPT